MCVTDAGQFDDWVDAQLSLESGERAYFGRDVLTGLVDGIRSTDRRIHRQGPVVLGCAMNLDDPELIQALEEADQACIVITKQQKPSIYKLPKWEALQEFSSSHGLATWAFPELDDLAPRNSDGSPTVVEPYTPDWRFLTNIGAVREVGFRRVDKHLVPIVHAKVALVGHYWTSDEHPSGLVMDMMSFEPDRVWVGSANFTKSSRSGLEMGFWSTDAALLLAARSFLLGLIARSEPLGEGPDIPYPELQPVKYDDAAFHEFMRTYPDEPDGDQP